MFNLKGPQGQNMRTTCGPRTTVWETLTSSNIRKIKSKKMSRVGHVSRVREKIMYQVLWWGDIW